jgi:hypothetical protein
VEFEAINFQAMQHCFVVHIVTEATLAARQAAESLKPCGCTPDTCDEGICPCASCHGPVAESPGPVTAEKLVTDLVQVAAKYYNGAQHKNWQIWATNEIANALAERSVAKVEAEVFHQHHVHCSCFSTKPVGSPGCSCALLMKSEVAELQSRAKVEADEIVNAAKAIIVRHQAAKHLHADVGYEITKHPIPECDCLSRILVELDALRGTFSLRASGAAPREDIAERCARILEERLAGMLMGGSIDEVQCAFISMATNQMRKLSLAAAPTLSEAGAKEEFSEYRRQMPQFTWNIRLDEHRRNCDTCMVSDIHKAGNLKTENRCKRRAEIESALLAAPEAGAKEGGNDAVV